MNLDDLMVRDAPPPDTPPPLRDPPPPHALLDEYIKFSRYMSPEGYEHFHEACGIWLLSVVAARRVYFLLGGAPEYTQLYMMLTAISTEFAKTETAKNITRVLRAAKLDWFLLGQEASPESFVEELSRTKLPSDFHDLDRIVQERIKQRLKFAGQGGWLYDEFGGLIDGMMSDRSYLSPFKSLLRVFYNCPLFHERRTKAHGTEFVREPYLALLGLITPIELRKHARRGGRLWNDGFWARIGIVCPPPNVEPLHQTRAYSVERASVPASIVQPLINWHQRLGERENSDDPLPQTQIHFPASIWEEYDNFRFQLKQRRKDVDRTQHGATDLFSYEARMPMQCLRIAALLASVEGGNIISIRHWQRARRFCDVLLAGVTNLYEFVNAGEPTREAVQESRVLRAIKKVRQRLLKKADKWPTEREIFQAIGSAMSRAQVREHLENLLLLGIIETYQRTKRRKEYCIIDPEA